jgi:hypothetical protein
VKAAVQFVGLSLAVLIAATSPSVLPQSSPAPPDKTVSLPRGPAEDYIGAEKCGECHTLKLAGQQLSEHAHSLARPATHPLASQFTPPETFVREGKFSFRYFWDSKGLNVRAWGDSQEITIPVEWAFGAGSQAVTFVSPANRQWYLEHAYSYYSVPKSYSITPGQSTLPKPALPASLGTLYRSDYANAPALNCFKCHSTGPVTRDNKGELHPHELGVRCEVCHGPGRAHRDAVLSGDVARAAEIIDNPKRLSADQLNYFCGNCHRLPLNTGTEIDWNFAGNVRHQPPYLSQSECFRKSQGALSCLTCHDPHAALVKDAALYNAKCTSCHNQDERPPARVCQSKEPSNCIDCHMPRVSPSSYLTFTNHWIGIYGQNKLKPLR